MKKISYALNILLLGILTISFISNRGKTAEIFRKDNFCDTSTICMNYSGTRFHYLDGNLLKSMAENYRSGYQKKITNGAIRQLAIQQAFQNLPVYNSVNDASSIWFSIDSLKRFIYEIESQVCKNKCAATPANLNLGIRIYYAKYPETGFNSPYPDLKRLPGTFENMHTVFMVPTFDRTVNNTISHVDCDPQYDFTTSNCFPRTIYNIMDSKKLLQHLTAMSAGTGNNSALNHGGLCPPLCNSTEVAFGQ